MQKFDFMLYTEMKPVGIFVTDPTGKSKYSYQLMAGWLLFDDIFLAILLSSSLFCLDGRIFSLNRGRPLFYSIVSTCFCLGHHRCTSIFFISSFTTSSQYFFSLPHFICPRILSSLTLLTKFVSSFLSKVPKPSQFGLSRMILYIFHSYSMSQQAIRNSITKRLSSLHPNHTHFCLHSMSAKTNVDIKTKVQIIKHSISVTKFNNKRKGVAEMW